MNKCGCLEPPEYSLTEIHETPNIPKLDIVFPQSHLNEVECLKNKVKKEYFDIIHKLECGILPDIENILEEISLIDLYGYFFDMSNFLNVLDYPIDPYNKDNSCFSKGFWENLEGWNNSLEWEN